MVRGRLTRVAAVVALVGGAVAVMTGAALGGTPTVEITITKTVVGTDPGVAFAITLTCDSQNTQIDPPDLASTDFQIPNNGEASEVVNLAHGQSTVVIVTLPQQQPEVATCRVTEDLSATTLPAGFSCTPAVTPESVVVWDGQTSSGGEFTVANTCAVAAVEAQAQVTG